MVARGPRGGHGPVAWMSGAGKHEDAGIRVSLVGAPDPATSTTTVTPEPDERLRDIGAGHLRLETPGGSHRVVIAPIRHPAHTATGIRRLEVVVDGWRFEVDVEPESRARLRERATSEKADAGRGGPLELRAIIPGRVVSVDVSNGDAVEAGGRLLVIEAMKMQNELRASRGGTVRRLGVGPGQTVERGDLLLVVE